MPKRALDILKQGHERFFSGHPEARDLLEQVRSTSGGQHPSAVVLSCIDSRVPVELVFDQGIGDVFSVRVAGNVVNSDVLASMEYSCRVSGARLVVVLGHTGCGAVKAACDGLDLGHLGSLLGKLRPAVEGVVERTDPPRVNSANVDFVNEVAAENVRRVMQQIRMRSVVLSKLLDEGAIGLVGAMYDVGTAAVTYLEERIPD